MGTLTRSELIAQQAQGNIVIEPWDPANVGPHSIDLHMGDQLVRYKRHNPWNPTDTDLALLFAGHALRQEETGRCIVRDQMTGAYHWNVIDSRHPPEIEDVPKLANGGWLCVPGVTYLARTRERTYVRGLVPTFDGRSSTGRLGVFCHITAGRIDNGFRGHITAEIVVVEPVILYPDMRYFQLTYNDIVGPKDEFYEGRYQGDMDATASRIALPGSAAGPGDGVHEVSSPLAGAHRHDRCVVCHKPYGDCEHTPGKL